MTAKNKSTDRECNIQKNCQGVPRLKYIQGVPQTKVQQGSATNKMIDRECNNSMYCQRAFWHQSGAENTIRECHNQKNCQEVSQSKEHQESEQSKVLPGSVTIKSSVRECRNHGYCQAVP